MRSAIILWAVVSLSACFNGPSKTVLLSPRTVRVTDAETQHPLQGVSVVYGLDCAVMRRKLFGLVPPEPTLAFKLCHRFQGMTDGKGEVVVRPAALTLQGNEELSGETILVNAQLVASSKAVEATRQAMEDMCKQGRPSCSGQPNDVDVLSRLALTKSDRRDSLIPRNDRYRAEIVFIHAGSFEPRGDDAQEGDIGVRDMLLKPSVPTVVEVALARRK